MLIVKKIDFESAITQGRRFTFDLWGDSIEIKIRPRTDDVVHAIHERHKDVSDEKKRSDLIFDDIIDFIIEDFQGPADEPPEGSNSPVPWPVNLANKKRLIYLKVPTGEKPLLDRILDKANSLEFEVRKDEQQN